MLDRKTPEPKYYIWETQQTVFPCFQDSDHIFLAEEDIMQHKWLKKANRLFLQALADLPDL